MWAKKIIAISDMSLCEGDFLKYVKKLARAKVDAFILREKDLGEYEYYDLAKEVLKICKKQKLVCFLHTFDKVALKLNHRYFHCPLDILRQEPRLRKYFHLFGTSVHSSDELAEAVNYECNYALFGHIFESSSKPDLEPKGLSFLNEICKESAIPIYAVGGINAENISSFKSIDVAGICMKSALMQKANLKDYIEFCKKELNQE